MLGSQTLEIGVAEFLKGMSQGSEIPDGGFSNETEALNLTKTPGVIYAPAAEVDSDTDTRLTGGIIASSPDMLVVGGTMRLMVSANGTYSSYNGTKIPAAVTAEGGTASTYVKGITDIITFAGEAYVTTRERIKRWQTTFTITDLTGGSFTNTGANYPHPAVVFEDNAFYGDGNLLLRQTAANTAPATILTLAADQVIIALGIDPGSGKMLISTTNSVNLAGTLPAVHKILWYDGFSNKVIKSAIVDDMVTAFYALGGTVFVGYGQKLGYLNGAGIGYLRTLTNVTLAQADLPYKQNFTNIGNTLYVIDKTQILAYGEVMPGKKIFYYAAKNKVNSNVIDCIFNAGSGKLGLCFATTKFYTLDTTSVSNLDKLDLITNFYYFPRPVNIRSAYLEFADNIGATGNFTFTYKDHDGSGYKNLSAEVGSVTLSINNMNVIGFGIRATALKLRIQNSTTNKGLKRIIVYYDLGE